MSEDTFARARQRMVDEHVKPRGIYDPATIDAMLSVPRHLFVPENLWEEAYQDESLPIEHGQVITQPYLVGLMTQAAELKPDSIVLDIGTGSGYTAAVLSRIAKEVYTIERIPSFTEKAQRLYDELGYSNVNTKVGDGSKGWPEKAPFDAIISTAGAPVVPKSFLDQLKEDGRLVIPIGGDAHQDLFRFCKTPDGQYTQEFLEYVRFVPLIGEEGWPE